MATYEVVLMKVYGYIGTSNEVQLVICTNREYIYALFFILFILLLITSK